jgi:hypothetical protein
MAHENAARGSIVCSRIVGNSEHGRAEMPTRSWREIPISPIIAKTLGLPASSAALK